MNNLEKAVNILKENDYTFVAVSDAKVITSSERGVKPLLEIIEGEGNLNDFSVADKVIGKAGAFLYVLLGAGEIYTDVISKPARDVLLCYNIATQYITLTDMIINRTGTGFCPMETAVMNTESPETALSLIRAKLKEMAHK